MVCAPICGASQKRFLGNRLGHRQRHVRHRPDKRSWSIGPVSIGTEASVGAALEAIQRQRQGYVLVVESGRPRGIMTEREVLMKIVARDVKYNANVMDYVSRIAVTLTESQSIARAVKMMIAEGVENIPIVDAAGRATAVLRTLDVIHFSPRRSHSRC